VVELAADIGKAILRPTPEEVRDTRVLFHSRYATDLSVEQWNQFGYTVAYHKAVVETLRTLGLRVTTGSDVEMLFRPLEFDFIWFTQVEAPFQGHELLIPTVAALRGISFLGPSAPVRAFSEDKVVGKALASAVNVDVAEHRVINPRAPGAGDLDLAGRWVLKPRTGVMSEHITVVEGPGGWRYAIKRAGHTRHAGREFIAEEFVPGLNLAVPVIEGLPALPVFQERGEAKNNILTESGKEGKTNDYVSEVYTGPGAEEAQAAAARLASAIAPFDYARFDFRFDPAKNRLVFLEVNMNCAMGPASVLNRAAALRGIDYPTLVGHIFTHSLRRQRLTQ
jgi:D-alanine-D-alanine ligase